MSELHIYQAPKHVLASQTPLHAFVDCFAGASCVRPCENKKGLGALTTNLDYPEILAAAPAYCSAGLALVGAEPSVVSRITPVSST